MGLVDPGILLQGGGSLMDGMSQGMKMRQGIDQNRDDRQDRAAMHAFQTYAQGQDITTKDGLTTVLKGMAQNGYAPQAFKIFAANKDMFSATPESYTFDDTPGGRVRQGTKSGKVELIPDIPSAKKADADAEGRFNGMKPTLDKYMTPPAKGWDPTKGEKAIALQKAIAYMPADVLKTKVAQDWIGNNKAEQQNTVFNPATADLAGSRKLGIYVNKFDHAQEQYEKKATPLQNLIGTMNSPTWGTAAGDVSLINQLSLAEFGGYKPSEAEYKAFGKGFTPAQYAQKWLGMAQNGNTLPAQVRDNMVKEVEEVSRKTHENFKKTMEEQKKRVSSAGVNPDDVIYPGGVFQDLDAYFGKKPATSAGQNQPSGSYPPETIALAKQALSDPKASPEHVAAAKKILGIQ